MTLSLDQLSSNLKEIYYEALQEDNELNLIPSLFSDQIYSGRTFMGRVWRIIHALLGFFFGNRLKTEKLHALLKKIEKSYQKFLTEITPIFLRYQELIAEQCMSSFENEKLFKNLRYQIHLWNDKTKPFLKLLQKNQGKKIERLFRQVFGKSGMDSFIPKIVGEFHKYQAIVDLEENLSRSFPYVSLSKLSMQGKLASKEESEIEEWVREVEASNCKERKLHLALRTFVENLQKYNVTPISKKPSLASLEIALIQKGLKTILQEDRKHILWRNTLEKGKYVVINDTSYLLGSEILSEKRSGNNNRVFLCQDRNDVVIVVGKNLATLDLRAKVQETHARGIYFPKWLAIDAEGTAGVQERMQIPISKISWKSKGCFHPLDQPYLRPFIGFIKFMKEINKSPKDLPYEHLYFDKKNGVLNSVKPSTLKEFDYALLENFAFLAAQKNRYVFHKIIEESQLSLHPYARYFEDIVEIFEKGEGLDAHSLATLSKHSITDPSTVDSGIKLEKEARLLYEKIEKKMHELFLIEERDILQQAIRKHIREFYFNNPARSFFIKECKNHIMRHLSLEFKTRKRFKRIDLLQESPYLPV